MQDMELWELRWIKNNSRADNQSHVRALVLHSVGVEGMLDFPQTAARLWRKSQLLGIEKFSGVSGVGGRLCWSGERQGVLQGCNLEERMLISGLSPLYLTLTVGSSLDRGLLSFLTGTCFDR